MRTKQITMLICLVIVPLMTMAQNETRTIKGVFDGYDPADGYSFMVEEREDEDGESIMYFTKISDAAAASVDLKSEAMIGKKFEITYEVTNYETEDDTYERYTIIALKKL